MIHAVQGATGDSLMALEREFIYKRGLATYKKTGKGVKYYETTDDGIRLYSLEDELFDKYVGKAYLRDHDFEYPLMEGWNPDDWMDLARDNTAEAYELSTMGVEYLIHGDARLIVNDTGTRDFVLGLLFGF